ncbi:MAG: hypothetical protein ACOC90_10780, partial [Bacteroidota bacterium]
MKDIVSIVKSVLTAGLIVFSISALSQQNLVKPSEHFGFKPGTDKMLFDYESLIEYLKVLEESSP